MSLPNPDGRGWIGIGVFGLVIMLLWMIAAFPDLRQDEFFQTIVTLIIGNGLMAVIAWAYAATKQGGELADRAASIVESQQPAMPPAGAPQPVTVVNAPSDPVPTTDSAAAPEPDSALPDYAR